MLTPFHDDFFFNDDFFDGFFALPRRVGILASHASPQAQCRVTDDGLVLELEVPRFKKEHISVEAVPHSGRVVVTGKRDSQSAPNALHSAGRTMPSFQRAFSVSPRVYNLTKLTSTVEDGVLTIRIPHHTEAEPASPKLPPASRQDEAIAVNEVPPAVPAESAVAARQSTDFAWPPRMDCPPHIHDHHAPWSDP
jgi:HSP20 family molecular chaperone IbpA